MIIDVHTHLDIFTTKEFPLKKRIFDLKKIMKENKISKSIILATTDTGSKAPSMKELILEIENEKNLLLIGTIKITDYNEKDLNELEGFLMKKKIIGIKLYPGYEPFYPNDSRCDAIYDLCEKYKVPVIFHSGDTFGSGLGMRYAKSEHIDEVAVKRKKLKIVIAHLGNPWLTDTMEVLFRNENVYSDISGLFWEDFDEYWRKFYGAEIIKILKWCGCNKLLFGTDWPCMDKELYFDYQKRYIKFVNSLKISKSDKEKIFYLNAQKVFGIK